MLVILLLPRMFLLVVGYVVYMDIEICTMKSVLYGKNLFTGLQESNATSEGLL